MSSHPSNRAIHCPTSLQELQRGIPFPPRSHLTPLLLVLPTWGAISSRERSRKLCRSPYFMNGRITMGLGTCRELSSMHTPGKHGQLTQCLGKRDPGPPKPQLEGEEGHPIPRSLMTLGWSKSFMHAASLRNSSISLWEKLSTGKQRERALKPQNSDRIPFLRDMLGMLVSSGTNCGVERQLTLHGLHSHFLWGPFRLAEPSLHHRSELPCTTGKKESLYPKYHLLGYHQIPKICNAPRWSQKACSSVTQGGQTGLMEGSLLGAGDWNEMSFTHPLLAPFPGSGRFCPRQHPAASAGAPC